MQPALCNRRRASAALLALAFLVPFWARAECACLWQGSFADIAAGTDLVVAGTVASTKGNAIDLTIEEVMQGPQYLESIRVWLKTQDYCRPDTEEFPIDSRWVMALTRIQVLPEGGFDPGTPNVSYGRVGDYSLSSCGGYWLNYGGEAVTGNLIDAPRWARDPDMTPVRLEVLQAYLTGRADREALLRASQENPELNELLLDTKAFLRGDDEVLKNN